MSKYTDAECMQETIRVQDVEIDRLRAQVESLKADAERYRFIKEQYSSFVYDERDPAVFMSRFLVLDFYSEHWDAAIDKALREEE